MLKVLLVDDEPFILQGLSVIIDWKDLGFEIAGRAANAFEALEILKKDTIDLVIADIKMPGMSGLEMAAKVREEKISDAYFVILSGYNDFSNVRAALQNECLDFLVKPVEKSELLAVLDKVQKLHEIDCRVRRESSRMEREVFAKNMIPICYGRHRPDNIVYVRRYLPPEGGFRYINAELDLAGEGMENLDTEEKRRLQRELYQKCMLLFPGREYLCMLDVSDWEESYDVGMIYPEAAFEGEDGQGGQNGFREIQRKLISLVEFPIHVIAGSRVERLEELPDSCRSVLMAQSFRNFDWREGQNKNLSDLLMDRQLIDTLIRAVKVNDKEGIRAACSAVFAELKKGDRDVYMIDMLVNHLMYEFLHMAMEQDEKVDQKEVLHFINESVFERIGEGGVESMTDLLLEYGDYLAQLRSNQTRGVLGLVETQMRENYRENLTLKDMGKTYYVNAAYLGQMFKKQYGESFKDYLNRIRIDAAVELLLNSDKKIYEIAEEVGYRDLDYFINKFIALKGCTPAKFRKQAT